ncbi:MAG: hypothetical protein QOC71_750, partial [Thermoplasmata archaeon]|nr:hypothetical protein [Thermoplasmata archaeon]
VGPGLRIDVNRTAKFGSAFVHQSLPVFDDAPFALHVLARDQGNLSAYEFLFREVNRTGAKADTTFRFQPTSGHWLPLSMAWSPKLAEARTVDVHMRFLIQADRTEHVEFAQPVLWSTLAFAWTIDEAPEVKTNGPFLPASLEPGEHRIGLTVEGAFGTKGQATLDLDVGLPDIRPRLEQLALATLHRPAAFSLDPVLADGRSPIRNPAFHEGKAGWRTGSPLDNWQVEQQDGRPAARLMAADGIPLSISQTVPNPCVAALCVLDVEHRGDSEATARVRAFGSGPSGELLLEETTFGLPSDTGWNRSRLAFEVRSPLADRLVVEVGFLSPGVGNRSLDLRQIVVQRAFADVWEVHGASAAQAGSGLQLPLTFTAPGQHELAVAVTMDRETGPLLGHGQTEITVLPVVLFSRPGQCFGLQVAAAPDMSGEVVATADGHVVATVGIGNGTQRLVDPLSARAEGNVLEVIGDCAGVSLAYLDDGGTSLPLQPPRTWPPPSDQVLAEPDLRPSWHVVRATLDVHALVLDPGLREGTLIVRRDGHTLGKATFVVGQDGTLDASVPLAPLAASGPYDLRMEVADTGLGRYDIDMGRHDLDLPNDPSAVALVAALVMVGLLAAMAPFVRRRQ